MIPEGTENVIVISCGLGIQTVADLAGKPVYAASNSLNYRGHHGMALTKKSCDACAQCYLNITGGICPIVDCSKSLVNGQCGGAKNGKCVQIPSRRPHQPRLRRERTGIYPKTEIQRIPRIIMCGEMLVAIATCQRHVPTL